MHFILAILWGVFGVGLLVWHTLYPAATFGKIGGLSLGWVALLLAAYNLARWWSIRSWCAVRRSESEMRAGRSRTHQGQGTTES